MNKIDLTKYLTDEEVYEIYQRIYANNFEISRENKIDLIVEAYKDNSFLGLLLTDEELIFLKNHLSNTIFEKNYLTIDLANVGILMKDYYDNYIIPEELYNYIRLGLDFYFNNLKIERVKKYYYILTAIIRIKGALKLNDLKRYFSNYLKDYKEVLNNYLLSPFYHRFFKKVLYRGRIYYTYIELSDKSDLSFTKFQRNDESLDKYKVNDLIEIGKHYFSYNAYSYKSLHDSFISAYLLKKSSRSDILLYCGENNYQYDTFLDKELLDNMSDIDYEDFDDFMRQLPSFTPTDDKALFFDAFDYKYIVDYTQNLYSFASKYYNIDLSLNNEQFSILIDKINSDKFKVCDEYILNNLEIMSGDEKRFIENVRKTKIKEYIVFKETNNGLILIDKSNNSIHNIKIALDSFLHETNLKPHYAKIALSKYRKRELILTYQKGRSLEKEEMDYYESIYNNLD